MQGVKTHRPWNEMEQSSRFVKLVAGRQAGRPAGRPAATQDMKLVAGRQAGRPAGRPQHRI